MKEAHLHLAFAAPRLDHPDTPALDVLAMVLGQGERLAAVARGERRSALAKDVRAWAYTPKDPGLFAVSLVGPAEKSLAALEEAVKVRARSPADGDRRRARHRAALVEAEAVYQRETVQGVARKLGYLRVGAGGIEQEARYYEAVRR